MSEHQPRTTAVVVTYHSASTLDACVGALRRCHERGLARVVFVDNQSTDGTAQALDRERGWATVVHTGKNLGFGKGCNRGASEATTPYVVFVNPDAEFEPEACEALIRFQDEHPRAGIVAPAIVREDGSLQHAGGATTPSSVLRAAAGVFGMPRGRRLIEPGAAPFQTDWVCGALFQMPTELFRETGGFDPRYFLYFEETDLCLRVREHGKEIWAVPGVTVKHAGGVSAAQTGKSRYAGCIAEHYFRSRYYYMRKNFGALRAATAEMGELGMIGVRAGLRLVRGKRPGDLLRRFSWPIMRSPDAVES